MINDPYADAAAERGVELPPDTDEQITALAKNAAQVRNAPLAALCRAALRGDPKALKRIERILANPGKHEWEIEDGVAVTPAAGQRVMLIPGREYRITYRFDGQRYDRAARMSFLGATTAGRLQWSARPAAGTQEIPVTAIRTVTDLGPSGGRDDPQRYVGRRA
jgi:hypothetical protein